LGPDDLTTFLGYSPLPQRSLPKWDQLIRSETAIRGNPNPSGAIRRYPKSKFFSVPATPVSALTLSWTLSAAFLDHPVPISNQLSFHQTSSDTIGHH